jgi:hypothetical protein
VFHTVYVEICSTVLFYSFSIYRYILYLSTVRLYHSFMSCNRRLQSINFFVLNLLSASSLKFNF